MTHYRSQYKGSIMPLVDYLKIHRRVQENRHINSKKFVFVIDQNFDYNNEIENKIIEVPRSALFDTNQFNPLQFEFQFVVADHLAIQINDNEDTRDSITYYLRHVFFPDSNNPIVSYKNLSDPYWVSLDDSNFIFVPLNRNRFKYYYNSEINRVVFNDIINPVFSYTDVFLYDPKELGIENGKYDLKYTDHNGLRGATIITFNESPSRDNLDDYTKYLGQREVKVEKAQTKAKVYLFPIIKNFGAKFVLEYKYVKKEFSRFNIKEQPTAISVEFTYIGSLLYFLNNTIFYDDSFETIQSREHLSKNELTQYIVKSLNPIVNVSFDNGGIRQFFIDQYIRYVNKELNFYKRNLKASLEIFYYTPKVFIKYLATETIWSILGETLKGTVTNIVLDKEDITLKILFALEEKIGNPTLFLDKLLNRKMSDETSYFFNLYNKMNTSNFVSYNEFVKKVWNKSDYRLPTKPEYLITHKVNLEEAPIYDGPLTLPYQSDKTMGFYHSNVEINWIDKNFKLEIKLETGEYKEERSFSPTVGGAYSRNEAITNDYIYHPFQPIFILQPEKQKTELKLDNIIPAFYLKAVEDKKTIANIYTTIEYGLDIATTFSGVGNFAKFRHLSKVARVASRLSKAQKAAKYAKVVAKIKIGIASIEITSGTVNTLIKLTGIKDSALGQAISEFLFWIELASLSGEALGAIKSGVRNSAKKVLKKRRELKTKLKSIEDVDEKKVINKLEEIIESKKQKANGGKTPNFSIVKPKVMKYWMSYLEKKGVKFEIGTENAIKLLNEEEALGLHITRLKNYERYEFEQTIYLYDNPSTSTFLEECYHALQRLDGLPKYMEPITVRGITYKDVDAWEYLAKKRILDEGERNGITYEEYIFIEEQLQDVLENKYNY